jgi:hypothetical protein
MLLQRGPTLMCIVTMLACSESPATAPSGAMVGTVAPARATASANGVQASATGGGHYLFQGLYDAKFSFSATQNGTGEANGQFRISVDFGGTDGTADFSGTVTCVTSDPVNGRAWIAGVVTQNNSTSVDFQTAIHQPGRDVWFRVLDSGEGSDAADDRTSFFGFTGAAGIQTSAEYCAAQIWPDANARTHPVTSGNIQVR